MTGTQTYTPALFLENIIQLSDTVRRVKSEFHNLALYWG